MQDAGKHTVVIASVLKPVDDTRGYEKMGVTLARSGHYSVHMIGTGGSNKSSLREGSFHSLGKFQRLSWRRWLASFKVLQVVQSLRPDLFILCTHELLWVAVYAKLFLRARIVYDVQENYFMNILHTNAFPLLFRWPLALYVRLKEVITSPFVDLFILAEKIYENQLSFIGRTNTVIENKAVIPDGFQRNPGVGIGLLFSGTLDESTGVFDAIELASALHHIDPSVSLHIIGYCAKTNTRAALNEAVRGKSFILLTGGDEPQQHEQIMNAIANATFGFVCYPPSPHTNGAVPTKVFEYLACRLPVLTTPNWAALFEPYHAAIVFDKTTLPETLIGKIKTGVFYSSKPDGVLWTEEGNRLIQSLKVLQGR